MLHHKGCFFSAIKNKFLKLFFSIKKKMSNLSIEKILMDLQQCSKRKIVLLLIINFFCGLTILQYTNTINIFFPHLICLTINIIITLTIGKEYVGTLLFLDEEILNKHPQENIELRQVYRKFRNKAFHKFNYGFCIAVLSVFFWGIFSQKYIELNLVGCYAVFIVSVSVSISVIGYVEYLWLLWFLYRIGKCTSMYFNKSIPAYTPFLVKMGILTSHAKWCFFFEGFLYIFEYFILIPQNHIKPTLNMPNNFSFLVTWAILFIVIILAFPSIVFIQELLLEKIVKNLKTQRIEILSQQFEILSQNGSQQFSISDVFVYNTLINSLVASADYPVKIQRLGPAVISIATFGLHLVTLLTQLPQLGYLFNQ